MLDLAQEPVVEKIERPAKQWRNLYRALEGVIDGETHGRHFKGAEFWEQRIWPSKEVAEEMAVRRVLRSVEKWGIPTAKYLGAFPVTP